MWWYADPTVHRTLDLWLLLVMLTLGAERRKAAEAILRWVVVVVGGEWRLGRQAGKQAGWQGDGPPRS